VFWSDANTGALYVRENAVLTVLIAEHATFLTAAVDGSRVLYAKGGDIYEDDLAAGNVTTELTSGAELLGIAGASEDASYVYFVAKGVLAADATAGSSNLYLHHAGVTTFIATLGTETEEDGGPYAGHGGLPWQPSIGSRTAQASPDGTGLVFMSTQSLTGYDNRNGNGEPEQEVFVYEADTGSLSCVSCSPSGEGLNDDFGGSAGFIAVSLRNTYQPRVISDGGERVFFGSMRALVPQDTNNTADVYEWEGDGTGSCTSSKGCVYLMSDGKSANPSFFLDASADGSNVFFVASAQLVPGDQNDVYDVYDARIGASQPVSPPVCTGSGCQGAPAAPPVFATPSSVTYAGVGNFSAPVRATAVKKATPKPKPKPKKKKKKKKRKKKKKKHESRKGKQSRRALNDHGKRGSGR
jgi:hypothetical protein